MASIAGFPFFPLEFTKEGKVHDTGELAAVVSAVRARAPARLLVLVHGWNNDRDDAQGLYQRLLGSMRGLLDRRGGEAPKIAVLGVFWPSKRFADDELAPADGSAGTGATAGGRGRGLPDEAIRQELERLKGTFDQPDSEALEAAKVLVARLEDSPAARREFAQLLRTLLPRPSDAGDDASGHFFAQEGDQLLDRLKAPVHLPRTAAAGAAGMREAGDRSTGGAAGFGDHFTGFKAAAWKLLNYTTYYQMKERAGVVGGGLNAALAQVRKAAPNLPIHLVGHSFGARAVTAAADGAAQIRPASLVLLQGAFSHHSLAAKFDGRTDGFFRKVVGEKKVTGPIVATHTVNDRAVGIAYAIASRISGDDRAGLGDAEDSYGGIGRNGAVRMGTGEVVAGKLLDEGGRYAFAAGKVNNLQADGRIASHGDVSNPAVANAVLAAIVA